MSDRQETVADIIAEKRRRADKIERDVAEKMKRGEMISDCYARELVADIRQEADRLEAAHRRERGDCAKLREAVALALSLLDLKEGVPYKTISQKDIDFIKAALAAPPRNCDRYPHDIALRIWLAKPDDPMNGSFDEWLYAPATELKGGNDAH